MFYGSMSTTEYCATRAKPSVEKSEYLRILGSKLHSDIDILWTGKTVDCYRKSLIVTFVI